MNPTRTYLGDGVYVELENDRAVLTTENGVNTTNIICMEPNVLRAFEAWLVWVRAKS